MSFMTANLSEMPVCHTLVTDSLHVQRERAGVLNVTHLKRSPNSGAIFKKMYVYVNKHTCVRHVCAGVQVLVQARESSPCPALSLSALLP